MNKKKRLSLRLPPEIIVELKKQALDMGMSVSNYIVWKNLYTREQEEFEKKIGWTRRTDFEKELKLKSNHAKTK